MPERVIIRQTKKSVKGRVTAHCELSMYLPSHRCIMISGNMQQLRIVETCILQVSNTAFPTNNYCQIIA